MRTVSFLAVLLAVLIVQVVAGCGGSSLPESSLTLRNATTNALISTSQNTGSVDISVGGSLPLLVIRTFTDDDGGTESADVTQFANFKWNSGAGIATVDAFGNVSGLASGDALLEVKFRASSLDPWDIVLLDVNVL